ncbi:MAG: hypothetical protein ACNA8W_12680 [Bradymonadaceae bacterium]
MNRIALRREDKNEWEKRAPLVPQDIAELVAEGAEFIVQRSTVRAFGDSTYAAAGAELRDDVGDAKVILGVKEVALEHIDRAGAYMFFSHTMKGQPQNMPMLQKLIDVGASLFDYELITDDDGRRLVFFGRHAGYAGALESLHALGKKFEVQGISTPLGLIDQPHKYHDLDQAIEVVQEARQAIEEHGFPEETGAVTIAVMGYGNVGQGVEHVLNHLGVQWVRPDDLEHMARTGDSKKVYAAIFKEEDMVEPIAEGKSFDLGEFCDHPDRFRSVVDRFLPHLTMLITAYYWEPRFPVYVSRESLGRLAAQGPMRLEVIGDITCDIGGSVEATNRPTSPADPSYTYDPIEERWYDGVQARGVAIMAVDNLPCELSVDASRHFSQSLKPFVPALAAMNLDASSLAESGLPSTLQRACILWRGELTERFDFLKGPLKAPHQA